MESDAKDLMLAYLHEMGSYDLFNEDDIPSFLTKESVSLKCGIKKGGIEKILQENNELFRVRNAPIKNRRSSSDCIFLTSKGVLKGRKLFEQFMERRVEFIDEDFKQKNLKLKEVMDILSNFNIQITYLDLIQRDRRDGKINLNEFIEPPRWKENLISDHAFPDIVILSNTSCMPFGGIFTAFGEPGIILPINKRIEIGVHNFGEGNVIRWMKRSGNELIDAYYIDGKKGLETLTSGHSPVMKEYEQYSNLGIFKDEEDFRSYFEVLKNYDYSIIFSVGTAHGISMAGHIGTILATVAMHFKDGIQFPFNGASDPPLNPKIIETDKTPVWDFGVPTEATSIKNMLIERHGPGDVGKYIGEVMRKFITLSQIFEKHWNSSFKKEDVANISGFKNTFNLREFSSGGACVASLFGTSVLLNLDDDGRVSFSTTIHPEMPPNKNIGLIIDRKGGIDNPRNEFLDTFQRFSPLISLHGNETLPYFFNLKTTSGELSKLAGKVILEDQRYADPGSFSEREAISDLLMMQKGIYTSLGIENPLLEDLERSVVQDGLKMGLGHIGVGNSGTFFFCIPDTESTHSLKNLLEKMNHTRAKGEKLEMTLHGSSHRYIFNIDPIMVVRK